LLRYFLRVDHVLFRVRETRLFHQFGGAEILRERASRECPYLFVQQKVPAWKRGDLTPLTDVNWVLSMMPELNPDDQYFEASKMTGEQEEQSNIDN